MFLLLVYAFVQQILSLQVNIIYMYTSLDFGWTIT